MTIAYSQWNSRLFSFFFNKTNAQKLVLCSVDTALLNSIGKDLGGFSGFIESVIGAINCNYTFPDIMDEFMDNPQNIHLIDNEPPAPDYFSLICFTVLAWTVVDPELSAGNYYGRLDSLIIKGLHCFGPSINCNLFTLSDNPQRQNYFRDKLPVIFKNLRDYVNGIFRKNYGIFKFSNNSSDYINIPKSQRLFAESCG